MDGLKVYEREMLLMASNGADADDIAGAMCRTKQAIYTRWEVLRKKLEATTVAEAVARALREGVIQ